MLYIASMWVNGITQGLMWRAEEAATCRTSPRCSTSSNSREAATCRTSSRCGDADPSLTYQVSGLKNGDTAGAVLNGGSLSPDFLQAITTRGVLIEVAADGDAVCAALEKQDQQAQY